MRWDGAAQSVERAREVYRFLDAEDAMQFALEDGVHSFPPAARERAYAFLKERL